MAAYFTAVLVVFRLDGEVGHAAADGLAVVVFYSVLGGGDGSEELGDGLVVVEVALEG